MGKPLTENIGKQLGERLLEAGLITEKQLEHALERQRAGGGRVGQNLVDLGFITQEKLNGFFSKHPKCPGTVEETGLDLSFISDLILKHVLFMGEFTLGVISAAVKVPFSITDAALEELRREKLVEVKGASHFAKASYQFQITSQGQKRALELFAVCEYVGPAPVTLTQYIELVERQTIKHIVVNEENVRKAFSGIVIGNEILRRLGPAISSGKAMFIYGPPGNGKTTIAETIGKVLPGAVYVPHAVTVGGQIIRVFDSVNHIPIASGGPESMDQRWVLCRRPVIMTGGELTLRMLDLDFNPISKFYEAPLQMKANNGLFIMDDFGRQQIDPHNLLNRWIVPLERRTDFMTLNTGMKFDIPFDQLVIFSTNIEPKKLVDEAFLRRIRYKIKIDHPSEEAYETIFRMVCETNRIEFRKEIFLHLMTHYYKRLGVKLNACHPRDIVDHIIDDAHYYNHPPALTKEGIEVAWDNYFVDM